jgi:type II secretory pathway predicted ATPase ExeA
MTEETMRLDILDDPPVDLQGLGPFLHWLGISPAEFAVQVGASRAQAYQWIKDGRRPQRRAVRIESWFQAQGISPARLWTHLEPAVSDDDVTDLDRARRLRGLPPARPTHPPEQETPMEITAKEYLEPHELQYWNLSHDPFDDAEDPEDVFLPAAFQVVEAAFLNAIRRRQIMALVGPPGAGKSTLLRRLHGRSSREKRVRLIAPASLDRRRITHAALSVAILRDLTGRETSSMSQEGRSELLRSTLEDQNAAGQWPVLLIDEAHLLKDDALLAIKHLWDSHTLFHQLAVLLIGQPLLESRLRTGPAIRELTGRTRIVQLPKLGDQVGPYLRWRFARVGMDADLVFDEPAFKALGLRGEHPLWVNNLAVQAMRYAQHVGDEKVGAMHVGRS